MTPARNPSPSAKSVSNSNVQGEESFCGIAQLNSGKEKKMCLIEIITDQCRCLLLGLEL